MKSNVCKSNFRHDVECTYCAAPPQPKLLLSHPNKHEYHKQIGRLQTTK